MAEVFAPNLFNGTVLSAENGDSSFVMSLWDGQPTEAAEAEEPQNNNEEDTPPDSQSETSSEPLPDEETASDGETTSNSVPADETSPEPAAAEETAALEDTIASNSGDATETKETVSTLVADADVETISDNESGEELSEGTPPSEDSPESEENLDEDTSDEESQEADLEVDSVEFNRDVVATVVDTAELGTYDLSTEDTDDVWKQTDVIPSTLRSCILYEDAYPNVDLQYDLFGYNIKESIIIKAPMESAVDDASANQESVDYNFSFLLNMDNLVPVEQEDGSILLVNDAEETIYELPAPFMVDAAGELSADVSYSISEIDNGWLLTVSASREWIDSDARTFPICIDPSFYKPSIGSVSISQAVEDPNMYQTSTSGFGTGYTGDHGNVEAYLRIGNLPTLDKTATITNGRLALWVNAISVGNASAAVLNLQQITSLRGLAGWPTMVSWSNRPDREPAADFVAATAAATSDGDHYRYFNITKAIKDWYQNSESNLGVVVSANVNTDSRSFASFLACANYPATLLIAYRDSTGIESYYTYETQAAGRAGAGSVNDYNGNLTFMNSDVNFPNTALPFNLNHVYNSSLSDDNIGSLSWLHIPNSSKTAKYGAGWQLSAMETMQIFRTEQPDEKEYLVYRDGDGTQHYLTGSVYTNYKDEDGLGLTVTATSTSSTADYTMTDNEGNKKFFKYGLLTYIQDGNGNRVCFAYNGNSYSSSGTAWHPATSGNKLTSVVAVNKGQSATTICTLSYNGDYLASITDFANRTTSYSYTGKNLTQITYPDGVTSNYTYDPSGQLISAFDSEACIGVEYDYSLDGISAIREYSITDAGERVYGTQVSREKNGIQETKYRYSGNDGILNNTDDLVTRYAFDFAGRTINAATMDYTENTLYGVTAAAYSSGTGTNGANRIEKDVQTGQNGINLLVAGGGETHDSFTTANNYWLKLATGTGRSATVKTGERSRTGSSALKIWLSGNASVENGHRRMGLYQSVSLQAGKPYTFSAYVNTQDISTYAVNNAGLYVAFLDSSNNILAESTRVTSKTNTNIENGWQRVSVTYTPAAAGTYRVAVMQEDAYPYGYFDDLQLETGATASNVNLIQDGTFSFSGNGENERKWTDTRIYLNHSTATIYGSYNYPKRDSQTVPINGPASDTYLISGWGKAASAADLASKLAYPENNYERYFGLMAKVNYSDSTKEYFYVPFNHDYTGWQFASGIIAPTKDNQGKTISNIVVYVVYDNNINSAQFDNISLRKEPCTEYSGPNSIMNPVTGNQHSGNKEIMIPGTWKSNCSHLLNVSL